MYTLTTPEEVNQRKIQGITGDNMSVLSLATAPVWF